MASTAFSSLLSNVSSIIVVSPLSAVNDRFTAARAVLAALADAVYRRCACTRIFADDRIACAVWKQLRHGQILGNIGISLMVHASLRKAQYSSMLFKVSSALHKASVILLCRLLIVKLPYNIFRNAWIYASANCSRGCPIMVWPLWSRVCCLFGSNPTQAPLYFANVLMYWIIPQLFCSVNRRTRSKTGTLSSFFRSKQTKAHPSLRVFNRALSKICALLRQSA